MASALVRAGRRLSDMMMDAPWTVANVERPNASSPSPDGAQRLRDPTADRAGDRVRGQLRWFTLPATAIALDVVELNRAVAIAMAAKAAVSNLMTFLHGTFRNLYQNLSRQIPKRCFLLRC